MILNKLGKLAPMMLYKCITLGAAECGTGLDARNRA